MNSTESSEYSSRKALSCVPSITWTRVGCILTRSLPRTLDCSSATEVKASSKPCNNGSRRSNSPRPSSVSETDRVVRSRTRTPRRFSRRATARLATDCDKSSNLAALAKLPHRTTATKRLESLRVCSSNLMIIAFNAILLCIICANLHNPFERHISVPSLRLPKEGIWLQSLESQARSEVGLRAVFSHRDEQYEQ